MRHSAGRAMLAAHPMPLLNGTPVRYTGSITTAAVGSTATVTTPAFVPQLGDVIVVKATSGVYTVRATAISNSGTAIPFGTAIFTSAPTGNCPLCLWQATIPAANAGVSTTISVTYTASTAQGSTNTVDVVVERYTNARAAAPVNVVAGASAAATPSNNPSISITPVSQQSIITYCLADYDAYGTSQSITLPNGAARTIADFFTSAVLATYNFTLPAASPGGAGVMGMVTQNSVTGSASTGIQAIMGAVEIRPIGA